MSRSASTSASTGNLAKGVPETSPRSATRTGRALRHASTNPDDQHQKDSMSDDDGASELSSASSNDRSGAESELESELSEVSGDEQADGDTPDSDLSDLSESDDDDAKDPTSEPSPRRSGRRQTAAGTSASTSTQPPKKSKTTTSKPADQRKPRPASTSTPASEQQKSNFDIASLLEHGEGRRATRGAAAALEAAEEAARIESAAAAAKAARAAKARQAQEAPAPALTERQKAKIEADKQAAAAEAAKKREMKKLEAEAKKEQKRQERLAWLEYRRKQVEEERALEAAAEESVQSEQESEEKEKRSPKKRVKLDSGAQAAGRDEQDGHEADISTHAATSKRRGRKPKPIIHKKPPVQPLDIPDYLALAPELRSKPCLQDVRPAYLYPDLPSCSLEEWDEEGIPVFEPTMEQFEDFYAYMTAVDAWGMRSGIIKIVPPKEWLEALPSVRKADVEAAGFDPRAAIESVRIKSAIEQNFTLAGSGVWRQTNVVKPAKVWNLKTWADEAARPHRRGPELKRMQRKCTLDEQAQEAARKGVEVVGSRTRSGRLVDGMPARPGVPDKTQRKRKRESTAVPGTNDQPATDGNAAASAPTQHTAVEASEGERKDPIKQVDSVASDSAHSPQSSMFDQQNGPGSPRTSVTTAHAPSPEADHVLGKSPEAAGQTMEQGTTQGAARSMAGAPVAAKEEPAEMELTREQADPIPQRKRSDSVSGKLQPCLLPPLEASLRRQRAKSMCAEQSPMLKVMRDHHLAGIPIPKRQRKRPDWHPKKRTEADKTTSSEWNNFDFVNCWLQEAASFEEPPAEQAPSEGSGSTSSGSVSGEAKLVVPAPNEWTPDICRQIEGEYWRGLNGGIAPMYGADQEGTLFTPRTKNWNVGSLDNILTRMKLKTQLPGVTTPYLYLGMWRATFAWHVEDMDLYSINYIHFGAPKQWYAIRQSDRVRFENIMKAAFPQDSGRCPQFMRHKSYLASPTYLRERGVEPLRLVHNAQEFVITYPFGYHSGYNLGFNCAESVNFALEPWVEIGRKAEACGCVDYSVRMNVEALLEESNALKAEEEQAVDPVVEESEDEDDEEMDTTVADEGKGDTNATVDLDERKRAKQALKEKKMWLKEGQRIESERAALKDGPMRGESLDEFAWRAIELRKAYERFEEWQSKHAAEVKARRSEAQLLRKQREQLNKERALQQEAENAQRKCPCVFCLSSLDFDLVEIASDDPSAPKKMAHRSCVSLVPETYLMVSDEKDVVYGFDNIPKSRWGLRCGTCKVPYGVPIQCTYGKCVTAGHISCILPDEVVPDAGREQWMVKQVPRKEADILNGKAKKPSKKAKAAQAKQKAKGAPVAPVSATAPISTELPAAPVANSVHPHAIAAENTTSQPSADASMDPSAEDARMADAVAVVAAAAAAAAAAATTEAGTSTTTSAVEGGVLPGTLDLDPALGTLPAEGMMEEEEEIVVLCPTHNPEWKAIIAARKNAKKLEELRKRALQLIPGTLVKYRHKSGAVWQALLLEIQDAQDTEGRIIVRDDALGSMAVPWSRIVFESPDSIVPSKRKEGEAEAAPSADDAKRTRTEGPPQAPLQWPAVMSTALPTALPAPLPTALPAPLPSAIPTSSPTALPNPIPTALPPPLPAALPGPVSAPVASVDASQSINAPTDALAALADQASATAAISLDRHQQSAYAPAP